MAQRLLYGTLCALTAGSLQVETRSLGFTGGWKNGIKRGWGVSVDISVVMGRTLPSRLDRVAPATNLFQPPANPSGICEQGEDVPTLNQTPGDRE